MINNDKIIVDDHPNINEPLDYRLRCATKRIDLPDDVIRLISDAYHEVCGFQLALGIVKDRCDSLLSTNEELEASNKNLKEGFEGGCHLCETVGETNKRLRQERDEARRDVADAYSKKTMNGVIVKTLNGIVTDGGKAVPPKYEDLEDE